MKPGLTVKPRPSHESNEKCACLRAAYALPCPALPCPTLLCPESNVSNSPAVVGLPASVDCAKSSLQETEAHLSHGYLTHTQERGGGERASPFFSFEHTIALTC